MCLTRSVIVGGMVEKAPKTKKKRESLGIPFAFLMILYCCYSFRLLYFSDFFYTTSDMKLDLLLFLHCMKKWIF